MEANFQSLAEGSLNYRTQGLIVNHGQPVLERKGEKGDPGMAIATSKRMEAS
jgi:hypothetical protein